MWICYSVLSLLTLGLLYLLIKTHRIESEERRKEYEQSKVMDQIIKILTPYSSSSPSSVSPPSTVSVIVPPVMPVAPPLITTPISTPPTSSPTTTTTSTDTSPSSSPTTTTSS